MPGLRLEELARLAGVSMAYYTRLEQGNGRNVSVEALDAISGALELSDAEHAHLLHLAKPKQHRRRPAPQRQWVRPALLELLTAMEGVPAYVGPPPSSAAAPDHCYPSGRARRAMRTGRVHRPAGVSGGALTSA
ncbi:helix-turn-helix domain-containing protein [Streptosporangium lutulentum]